LRRHRCLKDNSHGNQNKGSLTVYFSYRPQVREEYIDGKHHLDLEILRTGYEAMIAPLLGKTITCLHQALNDAKVTPRDLKRIMLVGDATYRRSLMLTKSVMKASPPPSPHRSC
jgi:molecular chaperone DnaK (HSP70)